MGKNEKKWEKMRKNWKICEVYGNNGKIMGKIKKIGN